MDVKGKLDLWVVWCSGIKANKGCWLLRVLDDNNQRLVTEESDCLTEDVKARRISSQSEADSFIEDAVIALSLKSPSLLPQDSL